MNIIDLQDNLFCLSESGQIGKCFSETCTRYVVKQLLNDYESNLHELLEAEAVQYLPQLYSWQAVTCYSLFFLYGPCKVWTAAVAFIT